MIVLYKKGDTHNIGGVKCEIGRFKNNEITFRLAEGWKVSPKDLVERKKESKTSLPPLKKTLSRQKSFEESVDHAKD